VTRLAGKVPLFLLNKPEDVFDSRPGPTALLVDLEGTLTGFRPTDDSVVEAVTRFDELAKRNGINLPELHYVTNADMSDLGKKRPEVLARVHRRAHKPFFTPPPEFRSRGHRAVVVGDQYLTDGLLAWRWGFSFGLVSEQAHAPMWPRAQLAAGRAVSRVFFSMANTCRR
jgi:predicted HAD superfamily phosphohydrolase YqeG